MPSQTTFATLYDCEGCLHREAELAHLRRQLERTEAERFADEQMRIERDLIAWKRKHLKHPEIWQTIEARCIDLWNSGRRRYAIGAVFEQLRHHWRGMGNIEADPFKLSNTMRAIYARMFIAYHPEMCDLFDLHKSHFDGVKPWEDVQT